MAGFIKNYLLIPIIFLILSTTVFASWSRTYGGTEQDEGRAVLQTDDGGYIMTGQTNSFGVGHYDVYVIKTDSVGDTVWTRTYGDVNDDYGKSIQKTSDGNYVIVGSTWLNGFRFDVYLIKIDPIGDTIWTRHYGGSESDHGYSVQETSDSGFIISGVYDLYGYPDEGDVYLIRTDSVGDTIWTRRYGAVSKEEGFSVQQSYDGGYIVVGRTNTDSIYPYGDDDILLLKININGDSIWSKTFGDNLCDIGYSVQQTIDSGFVLAGWTSSELSGVCYYYLIKTDKNGDSIWSSKYGSNCENRCYDLTITDNFNYVLVGFKAQSIGNHDVFLVKADINGNLIWSRAYGGFDYDRGYSVKQTEDGGYVILGQTVSFGMGSWDFYLIKTDSIGLLNVDESIIEESDYFSVNLILLKNKFVQLEFSIPQDEYIRLKIFDTTGRFISSPINGYYTRGNYRIVFNLERTGIYFFNLSSDSHSNSGKFIVLN